MKFARAAMSVYDGKPIARNTLSNGTMVKMRPNRMNSGDPGGCGTPMVYAQAMNSPQSQNEVVGAIDAK